MSVSVGLVLFATGHVWEGSARVDAWRAGRHCVFPLYGVEHSWKLGLVRRLMTLSGMLLRCQSEALDCCCVENGWIMETILTIRTLRVSRS